LRLLPRSAILVSAGIWSGHLSLDTLKVFSASPAIETLSVLPFASGSSDPADLAYWAGLTQSVTTRLAALPAGRRVHVTPAGDVVARRVRSIRDAYVELGASHVIRGRPTSDATATHVQLDLVDVASERVVRTAGVSVTADERVVLQNRLVDAILGLVEITLTPEEMARLTVAPASAGARDFYLQGLGYLQDDSKDGEHRQRDRGLRAGAQARSETCAGLRRVRGGLLAEIHGEPRPAVGNRRTPDM
jgi:TolB-like protein